MKSSSFIIFLTIIFSICKSQNEITNFIYGESQNLINDTEILIEGYMSPIGKWFGTGLNAGWYNTSRPHQFPGFDVTAGFHVITPDNDLFFNPYSKLQSLSYDNSQEIPTILGPDQTVQMFYNEEELFNSPPGLDWNGPMLMPFLQGSVGLIKKTELLFRYAPRINLRRLNAGFWGIGFKHDVKQWLPVVKPLPFDLSFLSSYSNLKSSFDFENEGQQLKFNVKSFSSNLIISKKLLFLTTYMGIGYQYSKSNFALNGRYTIYDWDGNELNEGSAYEVSDPFNFSFGGVSGLKATVGARIKLLLFTIHVDWTKAQYDVFTIGFGLNSDIGSKLIGGGIEKSITK